MAYNTVYLMGDFGNKYDEGRAAAAITPGHLIERESAGTLSVHDTAGGETAVKVAVEDSLQGRTIDDAYAEGELVRYVIPQKGDRLYMILTTAQTIVVGDLLASAGNGTLQAVGSDTPLFEAQEAVTTTGTVARIIVSVL